VYVFVRVWTWLPSPSVDLAPPPPTLPIRSRQGHERRQWDNRQYEEQCFYFNTIVRTARHHHGVLGAALDSTWDHAAEVEILRDYLVSRDEGFEGRSRAEQNKEIARWSVRITEKIPGQQANEWLRQVDYRIFKGQKRSERPGRRGGEAAEGDGGDDDRKRRRVDDGKEA
jgi:hypothetical protein